MRLLAQVPAESPGSSPAQSPVEAQRHFNSPPPAVVVHFVFVLYILVHSCEEHSGTKQHHISSRAARLTTATNRIAAGEKLTVASLVILVETLVDTPTVYLLYPPSAPSGEAPLFLRECHHHREHRDTLDTPPSQTACHSLPTPEGNPNPPSTMLARHFATA